ncbi:uncharacterized protein V1516DRAFT_696007 [Lipomyces oligophaga]|uniref:uncharacterized protein n=1 Tax=Lipomyces oligophaga TaxID=45792 RepID=UPI0034CEB645
MLLNNKEMVSRPAEPAKDSPTSNAIPTPPRSPPTITTLGIDFTRTFPGLSLDELVRPSTPADENDSECCGGGCCAVSSVASASCSSDSLSSLSPASSSIAFPDNLAFKQLKLPLLKISRSARLLGTTSLPPCSVKLEPVAQSCAETIGTNALVPPKYLKPHYPYDVHNMPIIAVRELTGKDALKRTYHFDIDVSKYPEEIPGVDFRVGGAVGICSRNKPSLVDEILTCLKIPDSDRDTPVSLVTSGGRWPSIWGEEKPRTLTTSFREILTWTLDLNNGIFSKNLVRVLAEYATDASERAILLWLCSRQGQSTFCNLRSAPYPPTLLQLLLAFPSSVPPIAQLASVLPTLMPRFYSLSSDPVENYISDGLATPIRRIEIAVTVHEASEPWRGPGVVRSGNCTGFLEQIALEFLHGQKIVTLPLFRGLQANPLAKEFRADGPMLLVGAGVGIAPFRGFVQRRLKNANCKNKVWVLQGCRDSLVDELYAGEWGINDTEVRKVVQSRRGTKKYVQDELVDQADLVWSIISHPDGRIFVCGSSKGMGEGVYAALVKVAMDKGRMSEDTANEFWEQKIKSWQYVTETW